LAVALSLYVEVEVEPAPRLTVKGEGEGEELAGPGNLAARVAVGVLGHDRLAIMVRSDIPVGRGLGSSAAVAVAAAAAAGSADPLAVAAGTDGHPENAAAAAMGGLVAATTLGSSVLAVPLALDPALAFVALVPDRPLSTSVARQVLPGEVRHADATFNLGRMGVLVGGLADHRRLVPAATEDRLHQPTRARLFPEAPALLEGLVTAGARAACWSGAGPSLLGICEASTAEAVRLAGAQLLRQAGVRGRSLLLRADTGGLVVW
jgi:homoserine kinase